jgi:hypothetical protein
MLMMDDPKMRVVGVYEVKGKRVAPFVTVFPSYGWVALGTYHAKTGGMDTFKNNEYTQDALEYAWVNYPDYDILMEGVIASTIKSTYANLFHEYEERVQSGLICPRKILVMNFLPPVEVCIERVYKRNGGKPIKEDQVAGKWRTVYNNVNYFREEGFRSIRVDTSKFPRKRMLEKFEILCDRYREEEK